jgi:DNA-binding transcriptional MerR regulator
MGTQLHIGEVAKLLGVTSKTIRHYHKVGLLAEPPRSDGGYRLYTASDLVRLQRIRRLQALGLSLKQIKTLLGEHVARHERTLREVLQALLAELSSEIQTLEEQRERLKRLLDKDALDTVSSSSGTSPTLEFFKEHLGEPPAEVSGPLLEIDMKVFSQLDAFNWPDSYDEGLKTLARYVAEHPEKYQQLLALAERIAALASLPEDAPEVDQLIEEGIESEEMFALLTMQAEIVEQLPQMASPFADVLAEITMDNLSPAQRRFLEAMQRRLSNITTNPTTPHEHSGHS